VEERLEQEVKFLIVTLMCKKCFHGHINYCTSNNNKGHKGRYASILGNHIVLIAAHGKHEKYEVILTSIVNNPNEGPRVKLQISSL